jgi:hypothetical protein
MPPPEYHPGGAGRHVAYAAANAAYAALLCAFLSAGALLGAPTLQALGTTFAFLWGSEKPLEAALYVESIEAFWVAGLALSAVAWRAGAFLSAHPAWLASLVGLGDGLLPAPPAL